MRSNKVIDFFWEENNLNVIFDDESKYAFENASISNVTWDHGGEDSGIISESFVINKEMYLENAPVKVKIKTFESIIAEKAYFLWLNSDKSQSSEFNHRK